MTKSQQAEYNIPDSEIKNRILNVLKAYPGGLPYWDLKTGIGLRYSPRCSVMLAQLKKKGLVERVIHPVSIDYVWRLKN